MEEINTENTENTEVGAGHQDMKNPLADIFVPGHTFTIAFKVTTEEGAHTASKVFAQRIDLPGLEVQRLDFKDSRVEYNKRMKELTDFINNLIESGTLNTDPCSGLVYTPAGE